MEIGGYDLLFETDNPRELCNEIMAFIDWPNAVVELDSDPDGFFWYKSIESKHRWDIGKEIPEDEMIYFIFDEGLLTAVVDEGTAVFLRKSKFSSLIRSLT